MAARLLTLHPARGAPRVILVHGIHAPEGSSNVRRLVPFFAVAGFEVAVFEYGFVGVLGARWRNPGIAQALRACLRPGDHLAGHSNGCALIWLALGLPGCPPPGPVSLIAPALDRDKCLAAPFDVYHNAGDGVVGLSRLLLRHAWGAMGRDGASCAWAHNIDAAEFEPPVSGHLGYFGEAALPLFGPLLAGRHLAQARAAYPGPATTEQEE